MATPTTNKRNDHLKDLVLLFAIPAAIAVIAAVVTYAPKLFTHPKYDFIYAVCEDYRCKDSYSVDAAGYVAHADADSSTADYYTHATDLRYYDAASDSTRTLSPEEAERYHLNRSSKSPDGYMLTKQNSSSGFLFWGDYDDGWYLKDGAKKKAVTLTNGSYYSTDVQFLGWVIK